MTHDRVVFTVNGKPVTSSMPPTTLLVTLLRHDLQLTGTHRGCETAQCGACTVLLDGVAVKSCTVLAAQVEGRSVGTIEGLGQGTSLHPMQAAFIEAGALQCAFCIPGMILAALDLVRRKGHDLDEVTIREGLGGNLCRCSSYQSIVTAVRSGARVMGETRPA